MVSRGGGPIPTRPLSPRAARRALVRLGSAGRAKDVVQRAKRTAMVARNFIFALVARLKEMRD